MTPVGIGERLVTETARRERWCGGCRMLEHGDRSIGCRPRQLGRAGGPVSRLLPHARPRDIIHRDTQRDVIRSGRPRVPRGATRGRGGVATLTTTASRRQAPRCPVRRVTRRTQIQATRGRLHAVVTHRPFVTRRRLTRHGFARRAARLVRPAHQPAEEERPCGIATRSQSLPPSFGAPCASTGGGATAMWDQRLGPSLSSLLWCAPRMNRRRRIGLVGQKPMP